MQANSDVKRLGASTAGNSQLELVSRDLAIKKMVRGGDAQLRCDPPYAMQCYKMLICLQFTSQAALRPQFFRSALSSSAGWSCSCALIALEA